MERELNFKRAMSLNNDLIAIYEALEKLELETDDAKRFTRQILITINSKIKVLHNSKIELSEAPASINQSVTIEIEE